MRQKKDSMADRILDEAARLFRSKGYDGTSIGELCAVFGFNKANIYNYFKSKEEILFQIVLRDMQRLVSEIAFLEDDTSSNPIEQLKSLVRIHINYMMRLGQSGRPSIETEMRRLSPKYRQQVIKVRDKYDLILRRILRRGKEQGLFIDLDEIVVNAAIASIAIRTITWYSPRGRLSTSELTDVICRLLLQGLLVREQKTESM